MFVPAHPWGAEPPPLRVRLAYKTTSFEVAVDARATFLELRYEAHDRTGLPMNAFKLLFRGREKVDDESLLMSGLKNGSIVTIAETAAWQAQRAVDLAQPQVLGAHQPAAIAVSGELRGGGSSRGSPVGSPRRSPAGSAPSQFLQQQPQQQQQAPGRSGSPSAAVAGHYAAGAPHVGHAVASAGRPVAAVGGQQPAGGGFGPAAGWTASFGNGADGRKESSPVPRVSSPRRSPQAAAAAMGGGQWQAFPGSPPARAAASAAAPHAPHAIHAASHPQQQYPQQQHPQAQHYAASHQHAPPQQHEQQPQQGLQAHPLHPTGHGHHHPHQHPGVQNQQQHPLSPQQQQQQQYAAQAQATQQAAWQQQQQQQQAATQQHQAAQQQQCAQQNAAAGQQQQAPQAGGKPFIGPQPPPTEKTMPEPSPEDAAEALKWQLMAKVEAAQKELDDLSAQVEDLLAGGKDEKATQKQQLLLGELLTRSLLNLDGIRAPGGEETPPEVRAARKAAVVRAQRLVDAVEGSKAGCQ